MNVQYSTVRRCPAARGLAAPRNVVACRRSPSRSSHHRAPGAAPWGCTAPPRRVSWGGGTRRWGRGVLSARGRVAARHTHPRRTARGSDQSVGVGWHRAPPSGARTPLHPASPMEGVLWRCSSASRKATYSQPYRVGKQSTRWWAACQAVEYHRTEVVASVVFATALVGGSTAASPPPCRTLPL